MKKSKTYNYNEVAYMEAAQSHSIIVWESGKKLMICRPLKKYAQKLLANGWCRIHRSYLVNPLFVKKITEDMDYIAMISGQELPISRRQRPQVNKWSRQIFGIN